MLREGKERQRHLADRRGKAKAKAALEDHVWRSGFKRPPRAASYLSRTSLRCRVCRTPFLLPTSYPTPDALSARLRQFWTRRRDNPRLLSRLAFRKTSAARNATGYRQIEKLLNSLLVNQAEQICLTAVQLYHSLQ